MTAENDLMPRQFPEIDANKPVKKPIEETSRVPNKPWLNLSTMAEYDHYDHYYDHEFNDINFDVD